MRIDQDPALSSFGIAQPGAEAAPHTHRQRMIDEACALVAIDGSTPLQPGPGMLGSIHRKLGFPPDGPTRRMRVVAWSGWVCAAAAIAWAIGMHHPTHSAGPAPRPLTPAETPEPEQHPTGDDPSARQARMTQEIEALRQQIKLLGERDAERMTAAPGVSWPVIMKMSRPGKANAVSAVDLMLATLETHDTPAPEPGDLVEDPAERADADLEPVAIPIYDPARDKGQLILMNLAVPDTHLAYHLWVQLDGTKEPILIGTLPAEVDPAFTTMDFRLGSAGAVPDCYWITLDARQSPAHPGPENIILLGPDA